MEQMVLRAQEQPCRCWRGNWPSGVYCFPIFPPVLCVLLLMFSKLWELTQNFSTYNYTHEFSLPLCPLELSSHCLIWWLTMLRSCSAQCPLLLPPSAGVQALHTSLQRCLTKGFLGRLPSYCGEGRGECPLPSEFTETPKDGKSFISWSVSWEFYVVPGVEHTRDVSLHYFGPPVRHEKNLY